MKRSDTNKSEHYQKFKKKVNSLFIEIENKSTWTKHNIIVGYIYRPKTPIYTGTETDTHAHCIPGRVAGRNDLSYIVNSGKTHCKWQCYKLNWVCTPKTIVYKLWIINLQHLYPFYNNTEHH